MKISRLLLLSLPLLLSACSSGPRPVSSNGAAQPEWVTQPARTVDGGYIVYVGAAEDYSADRARFKAEAVAVQDLANECSFAPKGTRVEDHYEAMLGGVHHSYTKVAIEFRDCEQAKNTVDPEQVRKLASVPLADEVKRYQDLVANPDEATDEDELAQNESAAVAGAGPARTVVVVRDEPTFFLVRQRVAYYKQVVILSPPATYAPAAPATQRYMTQVTPATSEVLAYEASHPALKTAPTTFSRVHPRAVSAAHALRPARPGQLRSAKPLVSYPRYAKRRRRKWRRQ